MNEILKDYRELIRTNGELDYKTDASQTGEEIYELTGYIDWLEKLCEKYNVNFNQSEIDRIDYLYVQNKTHELENRLESILIRSNEEIFNIVCQIKGINKDAIVKSIICEIKHLYDYAQSTYVYEFTTSDELGGEKFGGYILDMSALHNETYENVKQSHLEEYDDDRIGDFDAMDFDCEYLDLDSKTMDFVNLALNCGAEEIHYYGDDIL